MIKRNVLNRGFIQLVNQFGTDSYIMKYSGRIHAHNSPSTISYLLDREPNVFKQIVFQFHIKIPKFVLNELEKSELGSIWRLLILPNARDYYIPAYFLNKSREKMSEQACNDLYSKFENFHEWIFNFIDKRMNKGLSYSQAKLLLPDSQYVEFYWTIDAKALMEFIKFYYNDKNNTELQQYGKILLEIFLEVLPMIGQEFVKKELLNG